MNLVNSKNIHDNRLYHIGVVVANKNVFTGKEAENVLMNQLSGFG